MRWQVPWLLKSLQNLAGDCGEKSGRGWEGVGLAAWEKLGLMGIVAVRAILGCWKGGSCPSGGAVDVPGRKGQLVHAATVQATPAFWLQFGHR